MLGSVGRGKGSTCLSFTICKQKVVAVTAHRGDFPVLPALAHMLKFCIIRKSFCRFVHDMVVPVLPFYLFWPCIRHWMHNGKVFQALCGHRLTDVHWPCWGTGWISVLPLLGNCFALESVTVGGCKGHVLSPLTLYSITWAAPKGDGVLI